MYKNIHYIQPDLNQSIVYKNGNLKTKEMEENGFTSHKSSHGLCRSWNDFTQFLGNHSTVSVHNCLCVTPTEMHSEQAQQYGFTEFKELLLITTHIAFIIYHKHTFLSLFITNTAYCILIITYTYCILLSLTQRIAHYLLLTHIAFIIYHKHSSQSYCPL